MHKSFDDFVKKRISLEETELNKIFFFFFFFKDDTIPFVSFDLGVQFFLVLLSPVFVLKV